MREILFRGKSVKTGKWKYGFYVFIASTHYIVQPDACVGYDDITDTYEVIPETVGQFTGLLDMNGKKIFEGDFVDRHGNGCGFNPIEEVKYKGGGFSPIAVPGWECIPEADEVEVLGNIHDNPELLKEDLL